MLPKILVTIQLILFALLTAGIIIFPVSSTPFTLLIGALMMTGGLWLVIAAIREHRINGGVNITPVPRERGQMLHTGLYTRIRHPIYTGVMLAGVGAGVFHGHYIPLMIALILIPFFTIKTFVEESYLRATYPDYAAYANRTGRFLPPFRR